MTNKMRWLIGVAVVALFVQTGLNHHQENIYQYEITNLEQTVATLRENNKQLTTLIKNVTEELYNKRVIVAIITAYSPRVGETDEDPYITASMQPVREGTVAVSRDLFNAGWVFGRKVYIAGYGIFVITDLMHERKIQQLDIFMFKTDQALDFGRKQLRVALLN